MKELKVKRAIVKEKRDKENKEMRGGEIMVLKRKQSFTIVKSIITFVCKCIFYSNIEKTTI